MLRPDAPKQGKVREPRPGESADELGEPLQTYARGLWYTPARSTSPIQLS